MLLAGLLTAMGPGCGRKDSPRKVDVAPTAAKPSPPPVEPAPRTASGPEPLHDLLPDDARWNAQVPVDVLVRVDAPTLTPAQAAEALRPAQLAWQALPGVEHVFLRALEGEARAVVRFSPGTPPGRAVAVVRQAWPTPPLDTLGTPTLAAIGRAARARMAVSVLAPGGRQEATAQVANAAASLLATVPGAQRLSVAGAVRPFLTLEPLAPTLEANHQDLKTLRDTLTQPLALPAGVDAARAVLAQVQLPARVSLAQVASFLPGLGEPVREARNGHLPVTAILLDASPQQTDAPLVASSNAWRRDPLRTQEFRGTDLHPQFIGSTYRYALWAREAPESADDLGKRLQMVRELPEVSSVFAVQGVDGVPELLDREGEAGRVWTVWIAASAPQMEVVLQAVEQRLTRTEAGRPAPWRVHPLAADWDTALGWLLGQQGSAAMLATAPDSARLAPTLASVVQAVLRAQPMAEVRTGPQKQPPGPLWARLKPGAPPVPADLLALTQRLTLGPQPLRTQGNVPIWLGLPGGERQAQQGNLPIVQRPGARVLWSDLQQLPSAEPVLQQVAVDGRPALWLAVDVHTVTPDAFALAFADLLERTVEPSGGLRILPLLTTAREVGAPVPK